MKTTATSKALKGGRLKPGKALLKSTTPLKASKTGLKSSSKSLSKSSKTPVVKLKKKADEWHSRATRLRFADKQDGEWWAKCITCSNYKPIKQLQCGHFQSRMHNITRYDEENTAPQCYGCNVMHQGRQYEFGQQIDLLYGDGTAKKLHELAKQPHQFTTTELEDIIKDRKTEVEFYESQG